MAKKRSSSGSPKRAMKAARRKAASGRRRPASATRSAKTRKLTDPRLVQMLKVYEEAMRHFNKQGYRRAKQLLQKVVEGPYRQLADRAHVHLAICEQRLQSTGPVKLRSAEDHYHYAVSEINLGHYEQARVHLGKAVKLSPKADYVHYALASLAALINEPLEALEHLQRAIQLRPENRFQARNDADFKSLAEDIRFQELTGSGTSAATA